MKTYRVYLEMLSLLSIFVDVNRSLAELNSKSLGSLYSRAAARNDDEVGPFGLHRPAEALKKTPSERGALAAYRKREHIKTYKRYKIYMCILLAYIYINRGIYIYICTLNLYI